MGIKTPPAYEHPKKRKRSDGVQNIATSEPNVRIVIPKKKKGEKVLLRLVARVPKQGQLKLFDQMIDSGLTEREAILALLRQGMEQLNKISTWPTSKLRQHSYEHLGGAIETNRQISTSLNETIRTNLDPFGALASRAIGTLLGEAMLTLVAKEGSHGQ